MKGRRGRDGEDEERIKIPFVPGALPQTRAKHPGYSAVGLVGAEVKERHPAHPSDCHPSKPRTPCALEMAAVTPWVSQCVTPHKTAQTKEQELPAK
ncbi:unnamed protein product [Gulo gulo]|uniref:Uncharacterized protein n=1 Tax=Gulo gulo TaxID=48420 RepID=A0A9X9Q8F2_GULGU|nr:unnamed protein product [Gulo gulo]